MAVVPAQRPGTSRQDYETPQAFIDAVKSRFGPIAWDLAASASNYKSEQPEHFFDEEHNSLEEDWTKLSGTIWLNPPFADIEPWAFKCASSLAGVKSDPQRVWRQDWRVAMLTPASIGANWFAKHVHTRALVLGLSPRITFVGEKDSYPKDLMLSVFGLPHGFDVWRWS